MDDPDHAPGRPSSQVSGPRGGRNPRRSSARPERIHAGCLGAVCSHRCGNMPPTQRGPRPPVERRSLSAAFALTVVLTSSAAVGQDAAELLKGRQALVKSCVEVVNAQGVGTFEAVVDAERVIHIY